MSAPAEETHFGYKQVPLSEKQGLVDVVFHKVADRYDLMNDLMSFGLHRFWKDLLVAKLRPPKSRPFSHLDVAGGTGDIALRILDHVREAYGDRETRVDVVDINGEMLKEGHTRFKKTMYHNSEIGRAHV